MNITLKVWRQKDAKAKGDFVTYAAKDISDEMSFLEMLDVVNEGLIEKGQEHSIETLADSGSARLFDHFDEARQGCGKAN